MEADPLAHSVVIASHLWSALEVMASDMAIEPSVLVNQGVFAWLRINGYVAPGTMGQLAKSPAPSPAVAGPTVAPPRDQLRSIQSPAPTAPLPPPVRPLAHSKAQAQSKAQAKLEAQAKGANAGAGALAAVVARLEEIESDVARYVQPWPAWACRADEKAEGPREVGDRKGAPEASASSIEDRQLLPPVELDREPAPFLAPMLSLLEPVEEEAGSSRSNPMVAYVQRDGEAETRVLGDRFVIGRGPKCDLVIDSPRVSREHAAILRQGVRYLLEDLGSSNGTWFNEERVSRRALESGDMVRLGSELVSFFLRAEGKRS